MASDQPKAKKVLVDVTSGVEGPCLCVGDGSTGRRVAGPKPWGGGSVVYQFWVDPEELIAAIRMYSDAK